MTPSKDASAGTDSGSAPSTPQPVRELAAELRSLREKSYRSLRELQQATFASDSSLSRYLSGRTVPPWPVVEALCRLGDRDPAELRAVWERARQARGKRSQAAPFAGAPPAAEAVPAQDIPTRDGPGARIQAVFGFLAAAVAVGLVAVFLRRWRPPMRRLASRVR